MGRGARHLSMVPDDYEIMKRAVREAAQKADVVVINAGSSAGREDYTASIISDLGELCLHGVAMKPGKPVVVGSVCGKPAVGIPGYPVSAALTFEIFVKPIVFSKLGQALPKKSLVDGILARKIASALGTEEFVRVTLGRVGGKVMVTPLARGAGMISSLIRADGMLRIPALSEGFKAGDRVQVELLTSLDQIEKTLMIAGSHDLTIDLMANALWQSNGLRISSSNVGSLGGILALKRGEAHLAGMHLLDEETGDYNVSYVQRYLPDQEPVLVNLALREQGLMVAPGNPKGIKGFRDLTRPEVRFVNRQPGAGTRILLDYYLTEMEIDPVLINGYQREEFTHLAVAAAVKSGSCDAGLGVRAAARAMGLDFIPLAWERYDLCIPLEYWDWLYWQKLLSILRSRDFQEKVRQLGGYDVSKCGRVVWSSTAIEREA
ncbi:MAG: substrate-binding domain-containing protein [Bacillota bacterium]